jgi:ArsR family transcriptional regulator, arsenate/arsenite/antimonite-responsive transcriptional repressor
MTKTLAHGLALQPMSRLFKALGDETRLRIVALLSQGELCVCHVQDALRLTQPNASRQLGILKNAGAVESRRAGSWTFFKLAKPQNEQCRAMLRALVESFPDRRALRRDVERLLQSRGPDACK